MLLDAAARVGVDLGVDQLCHRRLAVGRDVGQLAAHGSHQLVADDQQAVLLALDHALDHDIGADLGRDLVGGHDLLTGVQVQHHAAAAVGVRRLDDHRKTDVLRRFPGFLGVVDLLAFGRRHAAGLEQLLGQFLVLGDAFGDRAGAVGLGGPDPALLGAIAELDQVAVVDQADMRDLALGGGLDDGARARAHGMELDQGLELLHAGRNIEGFVVDRGHHEVARIGQGPDADFLLAGAHHHLVDAALVGRARLAEGRGQSGQVLQLDRDMLHDVAGPGAVAQALDEAAAVAQAAVVLVQPRQPGQQAIGEAGQGVGGAVLERADVDQDLDRLVVGPDAGAAQMVDAQQLYRLVLHVWRAGREVGSGDWK